MISSGVAFLLFSWLRLVFLVWYILLIGFSLSFSPLCSFREISHLTSKFPFCPWLCGGRANTLLKLGDTNAKLLFWLRSSCGCLPVSLPSLRCVLVLVLLMSWIGDGTSDAFVVSF